MKKLVQGILDFRKNILPSYRETFARLALTQAPDSFFVACGDSRVVPNLFASSDPGDLFVLRNVGNLVPPFQDSLKSRMMESSPGSAIEFSMLQLKVKDIIVCGHSECGAMRALLDGTPPGMAHLEAWLDYARPALERYEQGLRLNDDRDLSPINWLSQLNVLLQIEHLKTYPAVRERFEAGEVGLHGWWFDIGQADVYAFEPSKNRFVLIDESEGENILNHLKTAQ